MQHNLIVLSYGQINYFGIHWRILVCLHSHGLFFGLHKIA